MSEKRGMTQVRCDCDAFSQCPQGQAESGTRCRIWLDVEVEEGVGVEGYAVAHRALVKLDVEHREQIRELKRKLEADK